MTEKFAFGNMLTWTFIVFSTVLFSGRLQSQSFENVPLYIWNGFSHHWGYNHRVNRLGDYLEVKEGKVSVVHTAASGSGADVADFTSYYTKVEAPGIARKYGVTRIHLEGRKGNLIECGQWVTAELKTVPERGCAVVLNGFDLFPTEGFKPDKFIEFQVSIDSVTYLEPEPFLPDANGSFPEPVKVSFYIRVAFNFACSTPECARFKRISSYELDVHWLTFISDFSSEMQRVANPISWTKDSLPSGRLSSHPLPEDFADPFQVKSSIGSPSNSSSYPSNPGNSPSNSGSSPSNSGSSPSTKKPAPNNYAPALGITGFGLQLGEKDLHFADFDLNVRMVDDVEDQRTKAISDTYFGQWKPGMYDGYRTYYAGWPKLPAKWVVKKTPGMGTLKLDFVWLGFNGATIEQDSVSGQVEWLTRHGKQESSGGEKAVTRVGIE